MGENTEDSGVLRGTPETKLTGLRLPTRRSREAQATVHTMKDGALLTAGRPLCNRKTALRAKVRETTFDLGGQE